MKASIIIPSYNACERLHYNLLSLSMQAADKNDFEIIVIDNGSTDQTSKLVSELYYDINLKLIRCEKNLGRSKARNIGIEEAAGDIIIFSDSDMISSQDFVSGHLREHYAKKRVVCGVNWDKIFTFYYKDFKGKILKSFLQIQNQKNRQIDLKRLEDKQCMISEQSIRAGTYKEEIFSQASQEHNYKRAIDLYGTDLNNFCFPWRFFITNNCSVSKDDIIKAGLFDESFAGWGCEDLDLGYRLYKNGCSFHKRDIKSVHQEHPVKIGDEGVRNIYWFTEKYDSPEVLLFYFYPFALEKNSPEEVVKDLNLMENIPEASRVISLFKEMLKIIRDRELKTNIDQREAFLKIKKLKTDILLNRESIQSAFDHIDAGSSCLSLKAAFRTLSMNLLKTDILKH